MARGKARTRVPGFENPKEQVVVRNTLLLGTDLHQYVDVLRCGECGHEYGSNGSNNHNRKCPGCQGASPGCRSIRARREGNSNVDVPDEVSTGMDL